MNMRIMILKKRFYYTVLEYVTNECLIENGPIVKIEGYPALLHDALVTDWFIFDDTEDAELTGRYRRSRISSQHMGSLDIP